MMDLTEFLSQPSNLLSIASLCVAIIAIIIAYSAPVRTEKIKTYKQARQAHFNKIKEGCLRPLLAGIYSVENTFNISEMTRYDKQWLLQNEKEQSTNISYLKLWTSLSNNAHDEHYSLDKLLFEDLGNHYPELKNKIDTVQQFLDESFPVFYRKRVDLILKLFDILEKTPAIKQEQSEISAIVTIALLYMLDYDTLSWPNMFARASKDGTLDIIKNTINQTEINNLAKSLKDISKQSHTMLVELRDSVDKILKFEGELVGMCTFLQ